MKHLRYCLLLCVYLALSACGGGGSSGGGGSPTVPAASPSGVWQGTLTENGVGTTNVLGLVLADQLRFISVDDDVVYEGTITMSGADFTAAATSYSSAGALATATLTGSVVTGTSMTGTFTTSNGSSGSFSLTYDPVSARGASLATLSANWMETDGAYTISISIDSNGVLTGSDTDGCVYTGGVTIQSASINIYSISLAATSCGVFNGSYSGYGVVSDTSITNDTLTFVVSNSNYILVGELSR